MIRKKAPSRRAAVDERRLLELERHSGHEAAQGPDREGQHRRDVDQRQAGHGVEQVGALEHLVLGDEQPLDRDHLDDQQRDDEALAPGEAEPCHCHRGEEREDQRERRPSTASRTGSSSGRPGTRRPRRGVGSCPGCRRTGARSGPATGSRAGSGTTSTPSSRPGTRTGRTPEARWRRPAPGARARAVARRCPSQCLLPQHAAHVARRQDDREREHEDRDRRLPGRSCPPRSRAGRCRCRAGWCPR